MIKIAGSIILLYLLFEKKISLNFILTEMVMTNRKRLAKREIGLVQQICSNAELADVLI